MSDPKDFSKRFAAYRNKSNFGVEEPPLAVRQAKLRNRRSDLFRAYLAGRGITDASADVCGLYSLDPSEHAALWERSDYFRIKLEGGVIPFFETNGKIGTYEITRILGDHFIEDEKSAARKRRNKWRVAQVPHSESGIVVRYGKPLDQPSQVYYPPNLRDGLTWDDVFKNKAVEIIITEPIEAIALCQAGYIACAMVSVWNFQQSSNDYTSPLIESILEHDWKDRRVVILYDSDAATNPNVVAAEQALANTLRVHLGARPGIGRIARMTNPATGKLARTFPADLLVWGGQAAGQILDKVLREAVAESSPANIDHEAIEYLRMALANGPVGAQGLLKDAIEAGFTNNEIRRAQRKLGIKPKKAGMVAGWMWSLPEQRQSERPRIKPKPALASKPVK